MTPQDRAIIASTPARISRAQLASMLALMKVQLLTIQGKAPSYMIVAVRRAIEELDLAVAEWTADESLIDAETAPHA